MKGSFVTWHLKLSIAMSFVSSRRKRFVKSAVRMDRLRIERKWANPLYQSTDISMFVGHSFADHS